MLEDIHFSEVANHYEQLRENVYLIDIIDSMKKHTTKKRSFDGYCLWNWQNIN